MSGETTEPWTIQRLLTWTSGHFERQKRDAPRLAAEILLSEALGCRRIDLYARYGEVPQETALARYRDWVRRHAQGEPVAYLVGYRDFYSLRFAVSPAVLVPRPETEQLVLEAIEWCQRRKAEHPQRELRILDMGTGSGCIAVTLAQQLPDVRLVAVDISPAALEVARANAAAHRVEDRIRFLESDLDAAIPAGERFELLVSNPPYVGQQETGGSLAADVLKYEPALALFGGPVGSELTGRMVEMAARRLEPGGRMMLETSPFIAPACAGMIRENGAFSEPVIRKDLGRHDRILIADRLAQP